MPKKFLLNQRSRVDLAFEEAFESKEEKGFAERT